MRLDVRGSSVCASMMHCRLAHISLTMSLLVTLGCGENDSNAPTAAPTAAPTQDCYHAMDVASCQTELIGSSSGAAVNALGIVVIILSILLCCAGTLLCYYMNCIGRRRGSTITVCGGKDNRTTVTRTDHEDISFHSKAWNP